jgi:hypothetical protein
MAAVVAATHTSGVRVGEILAEFCGGGAIGVVLITGSNLQFPEFFLEPKHGSEERAIERRGRQAHHKSVRAGCSFIMIFMSIGFGSSRAAFLPHSWD